MAENALLIEIIPDDPDVNLDEILKKIQDTLPADVTLKDYKVEPFVFGLNKLKIMLIIPEKEGLTTEIEETINSIPGISAEILSITRL
ncbi:MAG: elongation factor 1-beta [Thermoprotei archaeon]|nr:MAG: elongation factor 1-beta [Thermoprotei archaeon]